MQKPLCPFSTTVSLPDRHFSVGLRNWIVVGVLALIGHSAQAQFTLPVYESCNYGEGESLRLTGSSGTNWTWGNSYSAANGAIFSANNALSYPGLVPDPNPTPRGMISSKGVGRSAGANFTPQTSGTIYASFLFNLQTNPPSNRSFFGLNSGTSGTVNQASGATVWLSPSGQLLISKNSSTPAATNTYSLTPSNTYLVVLAYKYISGTANDEVDLWLNPTSLGNDSQVPAPTLSTAVNADSTTLQSLVYVAATGSPLATFLLDEIRVSTNWAGVTPSNCSPGTVYNVTGGGSICSGGTFPVGLAGSDLGVNYSLLTNGVWTSTTVSGNGGAISFGTWGATAVYTVLASNTTTACVGWMQGGVTVAILSPPSIVSQPSSQQVVSGSTAQFAVAATGDGLTFQWRLNGVNLTNGANISGATSPLLTVSPAGSGDVATTANGYDVVVSGACAPAATSTRVALSLRAQRYLTWAGDGVTNLWDVANSPNWSAGTSTAFYNGDNVSFDDGYTGGQDGVIMVGSLFPGSVTMNASRSYAFGGSGSLSGAATSLVLANSGALTVSNANSFGGGTTINNGAVVMRNYGALGSGRVTLAGGSLEVVASGSAGMSNSINVTSSSTLQYDGTGTYACVLLGALAGNSGATLTINHGGTGSDRLRLYAPFTNNADILLNSSGIWVAPYHSSGNQVYNGTISGIGQFIVRSGGGSVILNGTNTFSSGTTITTGSLGLGVNSFASFPPAVDGGPIGTGPLILANETPGFGGNGTVFASGGPRIVGNILNFSPLTNDFTFIIGGTNDLTLAGDMSLGGTNRTIQVNNTALTRLAGVIGDSGNAFGITKTGNGTLALDAVNTYLGPTTVSAGTLLVNGQIDLGAVTATNTGTLGGSGVILGPVRIESGSTLAPGASLGTLTINNTLALQPGSTTSVDINKTSGKSDLVAGLTSITYGGSLVVTNLAGTLTTNDFFKLFNATGYTGTFASVTPPPGIGLDWNTNTLSTDGTLRIKVAPIPPTPVINSVVSFGGNLVLSGTNGTPGSAYTVLSSTNVAAPLATWPVNTTGTFSATGTFTNSVPVDPAKPVQFLLLRVP